MYLNVVPSKNDGTTIYKLRVKDVPVDGFWSVSVYNAEGYFVKNDPDAYTFNNITAKKDADGSVTIQFGGCDGKVPNCLPIMPGWNYTVRLYRPRAEILDGSWKVPQAQPSGAITAALRKPNVTVAIRRFHQLLSMTGGLKEKDDGSLALYLQKDKPAQDRISTGCPLRRVRSTSRCVSMTPRRLCATVRINCRQSSGSGDTYSVCKGEPIWQPSRRHSPNLVLPA